MSNEFESCTNCIHADDAEPLCILRLCKHAIAETKECYMPKVQSSFPQRHENDCISRQVVIDELKKISFPYWFECGEYLSDDTREIEIISSSKALEVIDALPPAQPEQRWITSGKPMNSGTYLVTLRQKFEGEETYGVRIMRFIDGNWMLPKHFPEWINEEIEQEVLAWRELPEPWKEGEAE